MDGIPAVRTGGLGPQRGGSRKPCAVVLETLTMLEVNAVRSGERQRYERFA